MKKLYVFLAAISLCAITFSSFAQVSTNGGSGLSLSYGSLAGAIGDLNAATITSNVVITLESNETAPIGGYIITATGTAAISITIDGGGFTVTAPTTTAGNMNDAVFKIVGGDYISLQNFSIEENAANTVLTPANANTMTEFGIALYGASATNGAQNNTIQNNVVALSAAYRNSFGILSTCTFTSAASASAGAAPANLQATNLAGTNSNNKYYGNSISSVAYGMMIVATPSTGVFRQTGDDIGGTAAATGNTISYHSNTTAGPWVAYNLAPNFLNPGFYGGIIVSHAVGASIRYNTISTAGNLPVGTNGIVFQSPTAPTGFSFTNTASNNTIQLSTAATGGVLNGIEFGYSFNGGGFSESLVANANTITLNQVAVATSGVTPTGIKANWNCLASNITNNVIIINQIHTGTGNLTNAINGIWASSTNISIPTLNVTGNNITINQTNQSTTAIAGTVNGINASVTPSSSGVIGVANINYNNVTVKQTLVSGTFGAGVANFINTSGTSTTPLPRFNTLNIQHNNLNTLGSTFHYTGQVAGIAHDYCNVDNLSIASNIISIDRTGIGITLGTSSTATTVANAITSSITDNNISFTGTMAGNPTNVIGHRELEGVNTLTKTISNDTITMNLPNITLGNQIGIHFQLGTAANTNVSTISNCIININSGGPAVAGIQVAGGGSVGLVDVTNNTLNLSSSNNGAGTAFTIYGVWIGGTTRSRVFNNAFNSLAAPNTASGNPTIRAVYLAAGGTAAATPNEVFNNTISNTFTFAGTGYATIEGIAVDNGVGFCNIYKNKIFGLTASTSSSSATPPISWGISGIRSASTTTLNGVHNIYNNIIGFDNSANPNTSDSNVVRGISFTGASNVANMNVSNNTIYLAATPAATVANYGTSGIYHTFHATYATLVMRNNIIVNLSTAKGTGKTVAFRRSVSTNLANFSNSSNNNLLYAGLPGVNNLLFYDGVNSDQTLTAYKARVAPRETAAVSENPPFDNTTIGGNSDYLHIDPLIGTLVESGGTPIAGIGDDYDGDTRNATTPDIGADELNGTCPDPAAPTALVLSGSYSGVFTAANPAPSGGYIVFRTAVNTQPAPADGINYTIGNTYPIGVSATVIASGTATTFAEVIAPGTYYYWVFSFNTGCGLSPNYSSVAATSSTINCAVPAEPTLLNLNAVSSSTISGNFTGSGASGYLVVRTDDATPPVDPSTGTYYTAGDSLGTTGFVVYAGSATSFVANGLSGNSDYWFWVFPYNDGCFGSPTYHPGSPDPLSGSIFTLPCLVPGTYTIGPSGANFTSIGAVMSALSCFTFSPSVPLTGNYIFEFLPTYLSTGGVETFPLQMAPVNNPSGYTLTFRPAVGATARSITSNNTVGTLLFQGIIPSQTPSFYIFDGRPGGVGTAKELIIENTYLGSAYAVQFENGADTNIIRYCHIRSIHNGTSGGGGTINFAATNSTAGNSNNTLEFNDIYQATGGMPTTAIYSNGSAGAAGNNSNTIASNNIYNHFNAGYTTAGIHLAANSSNWLIDGNSFYQGTGRTFTSTGATYNAILAASNTVAGLTIQNNFIGGTAPGATGGFLSIGGNGILRAIQLTTASAPASSVQGNTITNIAFTSSNSSSAQSLINLQAGVISVGNIAGNILGSASATNRITISLSDNTAGVNFAGIATASSDINDVYTIRNNTIGGIAAIGSSTSAEIQGISFSGATGENNIINNTIGNATTLNSITNILNTGLTGILGNSTNATAGKVQTISGNTIANLSANSASANSYANGIVVKSLGRYTIGDAVNGGNTIYNISSAGSNTINYNASGIVNTATTAAQNIYGNNIYNINSSSSSTDAGVVGIYYSGATGANFVEGNHIHSLNMATNVSNSLMTGIHIVSGEATYQNNMIRLGITSAGAPITTAYGVYGMLELGGVNRIYMNSVYIGGSGVGLGSDSYAYSGDNTANKDVRNNIFWNARSNTAGAVPGHYAITLANNNGTIDYNDILATGTGGVLGYYALAPQFTLTDWKAAVIPDDANSYSSMPGFINPTGGTPDLHINAAVTTVVEGGGVAVGPTIDIDAQNRGTLSPVDIGADAFMGISPAKTDVGITALVAPGAGFGCFNANETITVTLHNFSSSLIDFTVTPVTITVVVTGPNSDSFPYTVSTGTLAAGASLNQNVGILNMVPNGLYSFAANIAVGGTGIDVDASNDKYNTTRTSSSLTVGTASSSPVNFCGVLNGSPTLTLTSATGGEIRWHQSLSSSGPWTHVGSNSLTYAAPSISTTNYYYAEVRCGATAISSNIVTVNISSPALISVSGNQSSCGPSAFTFTGAVNAGSVLNWYEASTGALAGTGTSFTSPVLNSTTTYNARAVSTVGVPAFATLGTGTAVNTTTGFPAPYTNYWGGTKHQILIHASELIAQGGAAGDLTSVSFFIQSVGSTFTGSLTDFTIHIGSTASNLLNTTYVAAPTLVYSAANQSIPSSGQVTHTFSSPFAWDGFSNIVIQTSYSNGNTGISSDNVQMYYTPTAFVSTAYNRADGATPAAILGNPTAIATTVNRPNMVLGFTAVCSSPVSAVTATVNTAPTAVSIATSTSVASNSTANVINICTDSAMLRVTGGTTTQAGSVSVSSIANLNMAITDYSNISNPLNVTVPTGATIDSVRVRFNLTHTWDGDLVVNLQSPNGQIVNLVNGRGGSGDNFVNTQISSNVANIAFTGGAPFTGMYRADAASITSSTPATNTNTFSTLFGITMGSPQPWTIRVHDRFGGDQGIFQNWTITVFYTEPVPVPYTWTPISNLYTNPGLSTAYIAGSNQDTVYAKPATTTTYTVTATLGGCTRTDTVQLVVNTESTPATTLQASPTTGCSGSNVTLTQSGGTLGTGAVWRWYSDAAFTVLVGSSAAADASLTLAPTVSTTYYLRSEGGASPCATNVPGAGSVTYTVSPVNQWLGVNTNWNDAANWCPSPPTAATNVTIPTSTNYPIITDGLPVCNNITLTGSGRVTVATGGTLNIAGAINNSGDSIDATAGTINFIGTAAQIVRANHFTTHTIANLTVNNTNTVTGLSIDNTGAMLNITGTVAFGGLSNARLTTNDRLTLVSDTLSFSTARIADVTNNGTNTGNNIFGKVVVERSIPAKRAWRLLTAPITSSTLPVPTISNLWQEGGQSTTIGMLSDPNPGYGTHISKGLPIILGSGYDQNNTGNTSILYLTPTGWNGSPSATNGTTIGADNGVITDRPGYLLFVRGNRATELIADRGASLTSTVLRNTGNINVTPNDGVPSAIAGSGAYISGGFTYNVWGNPYPSAINYHNLVTSPGNAAVPDQLYMWDANVTGTWGVGGWVSLAWNSGSSSYDRTVVSGIGSTGLDGTGDIQSGAAFMVRHTGSINFRERNKVGGSNISLLRPSVVGLHQLRTNLLAKNTDGSISVNDGILVTFNANNSNAFDNDDMPKLITMGENIGVNMGGTMLAIERRKPVAEGDTIQLNISRLRTKNYQFEFALEGISNASPGISAELEDKFTNEKTQLAINDTSRYNFAVELHTPSAAPDRFRIVFKKLVQFTQVLAAVQNEDVAIQWKVANEFGLAQYEIQRSQNGIAFEAIGHQLAAGNSAAVYSLLDMQPQPGLYYYRIKCIGKNGVVAYSEIVKVQVVKSSPAMFVFPNPVSNNTIVLQMNKMPVGVYHTAIFSADGKLVYRGNISHAGGTATETISPRMLLPNGNYRIEVIGADKKKTVLNILVQKQ